MAKRDDLIKYITQRVVTYIDTPQTVRQERRKELQERPREHWMVRWFGLVPFSVGMWANQWKSPEPPNMKKERSGTIGTLFNKWRSKPTP